MASYRVYKIYCITGYVYFWYQPVYFYSYIILSCKKRINFVLWSIGNARRGEIVSHLCIYNDIMINEKVKYKQKSDLFPFQRSAIACRHVKIKIFSFHTKHNIFINIFIKLQVVSATGSTFYNDLKKKTMCFCLNHKNTRWAYSSGRWM